MSPCIRDCVRNNFTFKLLASPTITPALRQKVVGAYDHIASIYSYSTPDIELGEQIYTPSGLSGLTYAEYAQTFNSVLLATVLNSVLNGSMIFFGPPGSGKTTTPEVVGQVLFGLTMKQIEQATIYCHPNLTEEKMTGSFDIPKLMSKDAIKEVVWTSWVTEFYRMLDEVNRMATETSSILMQAVDRRRVSYAGEIFDMPFGPVSATANYYDAGNFEMTPPFLDRFGISVHAEGLNPQDMDILYNPTEYLDRTNYILHKDDREQVYAEIQSIGVNPETLELLIHLVSGLNSCDHAGNKWHDKNKSRFGENPVECKGEHCGFGAANVVCSQISGHGLTTRSYIALRDYSRALAWFLGRTQVDNETMKIAFALTTGHRLFPSRIATNGGDSAEGVEINKKLFTRKTFDFAYHLWGMGEQTYQAQKPVYDKYSKFLEDFAHSASAPAILLLRSNDLIEEIGKMEDPAKFDMLISLHQLRQMLRNLDK